MYINRFLVFLPFFILMSFQDKLYEVKNPSLIGSTLLDPVSSSYIPISLKDLSEVDIELLSPLTFGDLKEIQIIKPIQKKEVDLKHYKPFEDSIRKFTLMHPKAVSTSSNSEIKQDRREFYDAFNTYFYRKINEDIISNFTENDTSIHYLYRQDINQKLSGKRYLLRCNFIFDENVTLYSVFEPKFYIFDTQTKTNYQLFDSISLILKAIKYNKTHKPTASMLKKMTEQEYLDKSIKTLVLKIRN